MWSLWLVLGPPNLGLVGFLLAALEEEGVLVASGAGLAQHELERAEELDPLALLIDIVTHVLLTCQ